MDSLTEDTLVGLKAILIFFALIAQLLYIVSDDFQDYLLYLSYILIYPIFFITLFWCDIKLGNIVLQYHLQPFPITSTRSLLIRMKYILFKKSYLFYIVAIYSSILFVSGLDIEERLLYVVWSILQTIVILLTTVVLYEFLEKRDLSRHLLIIPALFAVFDSFLQDSDKVYLLLNPFFVGCVAVGFLPISNSVVMGLLSCLAFALLSSLLIVINRTINAV